MAALSEDVKLLIVVLILLFAPGLVEATFKKVEQHEREELAISSNDYKRAPHKTNTERAGKVKESDRRRGQLISFTYLREQ